ncbi:MAG: DUF6169 family protein, partial [Spirosomaceae bacterium]|nr:DUF6169 family protein [Spirosomataceae bacterium]
PFYFPENIEFNHNVFELVIKLVEDGEYARPQKDAKLPQTIAAIFFDFFSSRERVVVFSCDTTDRKQAARHRKFNDWYLRFNDDSFAKFDGIIEDTVNDSVYFLSMIIKSDNPYKEDISIAFKELTDSLLGGK